jgi:hypothetical protein
MLHCCCITFHSAFETAFSHISTRLFVVAKHTYCCRKQHTYCCPSAASLMFVQASVTTMLQQEPGADALVGPAAKMLRAGNGTSKHQLLHNDAVFGVDQTAAATCVARLKEREAAAAAAIGNDSSKAGAGAQVQVAARASAPLGVTAAGGGVAPPHMGEAQLEVLRAQHRLSVDNAAMRLLGTLIGAVDTTRYMIFSVLAILGQLPQQVVELRQEQQQVGF